MSSTYYPVDATFLDRYLVAPEALTELEDNSLLEEIEQMLYGDQGCLKPLGFRGGIPRYLKERRGLD